VYGEQFYCYLEETGSKRRLNINSIIIRIVKKDEMGKAGRTFEKCLQNSGPKILRWGKKTLEKCDRE
jgi:hypothetical protein